MSPPPLRLLLCRVAGRPVGIDLGAVQTVLPMLALTPLPGAPPGVEGVANLGGEPLPVYALRALLGAVEERSDLDDHIVVCEAEGRRAGLIVDEAHDLAEPDLLRSPQSDDALSCSELVSHLARVGSELALVLDVAATAAWLAQVVDPSQVELPSPEARARTLEGAGGRDE